MVLSPDPVSAPEAYRRSLLDALGGDDPAVAQSTTTDRMRALVASAGPLLTVRPGPSDWSALECLGHLLDGELIVAARTRWIVAEENPDIVGYDQDLWVAGLRHGDDDPDDLILLFDSLRRANLRLWAASPDPVRRRIGTHRERGPESYDLMFRLSAGHDRIHLAQAERAVEAARSQGVA